MRQIILIGLLLIASSTQTTVTPKIAQCECSNLLNQADCISMGCIWKFSTITNSTAQSPTLSTTLEGICSNNTNTSIVQTYCSTIMDSTQCSSSLGCAFFNDTCTIFAGCSAYVKSSNSACQAISTQCTTDGIRCQIPTDCQSYKTQELCTKNIALSGAKSCNWKNNDDGGACEDKKCSDAPPSFKTQSQCNNWIAGCLTNGVGCVSTLSSGINHCIQPQANCSDYYTYGKSITENHAFCSQLTETTNKKQCASNTSGPPKCKDPVCGDLIQGQSFKTCVNYIINALLTESTVLLLLQHALNILLKDIGLGQQANCASLSQIDGTKCGWTSGPNCTSRVCSQLKGAGASTASCAAYTSGCQYDGQSCIDQKENCNLYIPQGATDVIKASICNGMNSKNSEDHYEYRCTYVVGQPTCEVTWSECHNRIPQGLTSEQSTAICSLVQDLYGNQCGFNSEYQCSNKQCSQASKSDSDCNNYQTGCELDIDQLCEFDYSNYKSCYAAPKTFTTNAACKSYDTYCVTNGAGCVSHSQLCNDYQGNQTQCNRFIGYYGEQPCSNTITASETDQCINRTCVQNLTAKNDSECDIWYPRYFPQRRECVWGGSLGCVQPQPCDKFIGTVDSCPTFTATDGPCFGTGTTLKTPCAPNTSLCTAAPKSYNSDELCKKWGSTCIFDGIGCISGVGLNCSSLQSLQVCSNNQIKYGCDLAFSCKTIPPTCAGFNNAIECNNTQQGSEQLKCGWDAFLKKCTSINCSLLPLSLVTDKQCSAAISTCTTGGIGCITKGACLTYSKQTCSFAQSTDIQKVCIWSNSVCRPIECTDNTTATSDAECNKFLDGCKTPGLGCFSNITCSQITSAQLCLFDSLKNPCLWYKSSINSTGTCINYSKCSDIISSSHQECQAASPLCTTNGTNCIAITACSKTLSQASCIIGTDGKCGWMPATESIPASCQPYTNCSAAQGKTNEQCSLWGSSCITDGKFCIERSTCSTFSYDSCKIGTDGKCFWVAQTEKTIGFCRIQVCSDATTDITTHSGCFAFQASTTCTTSGTACIPQAYCSSYEQKASCYQGTDGICWWATSLSPTISTSFCRLKLCTDSLLNQSSLCMQEIPGVKCVSNGINCIPQSTCSSYTAKEACLGGGSDGVCVFNPGANTSTPNIGTCLLFTQCSSANSDQLACNSRSDACYFNQTVNGTTNSQCIPHTCATKAQGTSCQPIPSWDLSSYKICVLSGTICTEGNPSQLTQQNCYNNSVGTYSWNMNTSLCTICQPKITINNDNIGGYLISVILGISLI